MNGFERRKEQKKESVRKAALELFKIYGFKKISLNDIASKANVSPVTIYNHFASKDGLVRDCCRSVIRGLVEKSQEVLQSDRPFNEKLEMIILEKTDIVSQFQGELMQTIVKDDPEFVESFWQNEINQLMLDFIEDGKTQGIINNNLSPESLLLYFEILRKGVVASSFVTLDTAQNQKIGKDLIRLFTYGLNG
ncbi:TetR/AcrR family transcriptional regulator [Chloroflexota bacterium]